ncbi:hypothetical protein HD806DRAFT_200193 [Xylariaceae sp. AK1471]|nr:hypothetical protein HD806DRAFT_200193 [Xylariaceae sp. AK1471]
MSHVFVSAFTDLLTFPLELSSWPGRATQWSVYNLMALEVRFTFIFLIFLATISTIAMALRFIATTHSGRKLSLEDWFALAALISFLGYTSLTLASLGILVRRDLTTLSVDDSIHIGKILYATIPFYPLNQFFAKFSILLLYYRLFSVKRSFVRWTYVLGAVQAADTILTLFINLFGCYPISYNWSAIEDGRCLDQVLVFTGTESINSAVDFAMVALASVMVYGIQLTLSTKLKLAILFVVGGLSGIIGFIRIGGFNLYGKQTDARSKSLLSWRPHFRFEEPSIYLHSPLEVFNNVRSHVAWTSVQQAASIVCCCAPTYKNLFHLRSLYTKVASWTRNCTWWRRQRGSFAPEERTARQSWRALGDSTSESRLTWMELDGGMHQVPVMPVGAPI